MKLTGRNLIHINEYLCVATNNLNITVNRLYNIDNEVIADDVLGPVMLLCLQSAYDFEVRKSPGVPCFVPGRVMHGRLLVGIQNVFDVVLYDC